MAAAASSWSIAFLTVVTDLGDSAVLSAVVLACAAYLLSRDSRKEALALVLALLGASGGIAVLKLLFMGCGLHIGHFNIRSPSGHAALSLAVISTFAALLGHAAPRWRLYAYAGAAVLVATIAVSRVVLNAHTTPEVILGLLVGTAAFYVTYLLTINPKVPVLFDARALLFAAILAALVFHGMHLPAETVIRVLALHIKAHAPLCGNG